MVLKEPLVTIPRRTVRTTPSGRLTVEPFAIGLQRPTHMEWTNDGRLLVSEHMTGEVKDITRGGDMRHVEPFAYGLLGPAAIMPVGDRILVANRFAGRIDDIAGGGDVNLRVPFAFGLSLPYNIAVFRTGGRTRILVTEDVNLGLVRYTDISGGGGAADHSVFLSGIPGRPHYQLQRDVDHEKLAASHNFAEDFWRFFVNQKCGGWSLAAAIDGDTALVMAVSSMGLILRLRIEGGDFIPLLEDTRNIVAWGLSPMGGIKEHRYNGLVYVSQPERGAVMAVDPREPHNYVFDAPVLELPRPGFPSCIRFSPDGEVMYVCDGANGVIWKARNF